MKTSNKIFLITINLIFWAIILFIGFYYEWEFPPFSTKDGTFYPTMLWGNFMNAVVLYTNAFFLYPYRKKLRLPYWLMVLLLIAGTAIVEAIVDYQLIYILDIVDKLDAALKGLKELNGEHSIFIIGSFIKNFFIHTLWYILSFTIVFIYESNKNRQIQKALEEEKLKAELKFLRAQINPHFLFNGINSVYFLIDDKPDIAKSTLLKFSDLLRYQLYECQDDSISLTKELAHIQAYIEMERIRRGEDIRIQLSLPKKKMDAYNISPLLFTPFLENAFKYVSNEDDGSKNQVNIVVELKEGKLFFEIENTTDAMDNTLNQSNKLQKGGIGLENVRKRLALLYPDKHQLDILEKENRFIVRMNIELEQ